jgi:hypothetical protein
LVSAGEYEYYEKDFIDNGDEECQQMEMEIHAVAKQKVLQNNNEDKVKKLAAANTPKKKKQDDIIVIQQFRQ